MKLGLIKKDEINEEIPLSDIKFTHSLCIGQTGSGKTTGFIYPNLLKRMESNHGILLFDIKGNEHLAVKTIAKKANRLEDVIEIGKPWGKNVNILSEMNEAKMTQLLKSILNVGNGGAGQNAYFYNAALTLGLTLYSILRTCEILIKEFEELEIDFSFLDNKRFSLIDIYKASIDMDSLSEFLDNLNDFKKKIDKTIEDRDDLYFNGNKNLYKNLILNSDILDKLFLKMRPYYVEKSDRADRSKFDTALTSVLHTLTEAFGFMVNSSSKYIASSDDVINIVDELQNNKIVVVNVRVIPDSILEILLDQVFEQLIDLNIKSEENRHPTSIFIDEAQRLVNKDIPLDVLRSSKVDVILAVQSELQLISKFGSKEDWQQISINIAQKYAFRSSLYSTDSNTFFPDTGDFDTFEYTKEYDKKVYRALPDFINKEESVSVEKEYQQTILKLDDLTSDEYYIYDVSHYEKEREVVVLNTKTNKSYHKKIFNEIENIIIDKHLKNIVDKNIRSLIGKLKEKFGEKIDNFTSYGFSTLILDYNIQNIEIYDESFINIFEDETSVIEYMKKNKLSKSDYFYKDFDVKKHILIDENYQKYVDILFDTWKELEEYRENLDDQIKNQLSSNTEDVERYFLFKKLPMKKLKELGYIDLDDENIVFKKLQELKKLEDNK